MKFHSIKRFAGAATMTAVLCAPLALTAQESHEDAKAQVDHHEAKHHTKAKIVAGSAAGGAITGAAIAGPTGAVVGAGVGAVGGVVAHKIVKHHEIKKKEETGTPYQK